MTFLWFLCFYEYLAMSLCNSHRAFYIPQLFAPIKRTRLIEFGDWLLNWRMKLFPAKTEFMWVFMLMVVHVFWKYQSAIIINTREELQYLITGIPAAEICFIIVIGASGIYWYWYLIWLTSWNCDLGLNNQDIPVSSHLSSKFDMNCLIVGGELCLYSQLNSELMSCEILSCQVCSGVVAGFLIQ